MKNQAIVTLFCVLLFIVLGIQVYATFRMNERLDQLTLSGNRTADTQATMPNSTSSILNQRAADDDIFKDQTWNPYAEIQHMQNEMEHMFGESFSRFHMNTPLDALTKIPDADLQETPENYIVSVNAPGADQSSVNVKLDDRILEISIKTEQAKTETDDKNGKYQYRERFSGEFHRLLTLPGPADASKMKTEYRNGVLTINIPKKS